MQSVKPLLQQALNENGFILQESVITRLAEYLELLNKWNRVYNLTSITSPREMAYLHIIDSLVIQPYLTGTHFLDIGTGAGLPGIPLAITHPEQEWTLLDKSAKKTRFLNQVVAELHLTNVNVVNARSEDFHPTHCFATILSRAYATLKIFIASSQHNLCPGGQWLAMKGKYPHTELAEIPDGLDAEVLSLQIKGIKVDRHIVRIRAKEDQVWEK